MTSKKHRPWHRELAAYWKSKGVIEHCEVRFENCLGTYGLAPAHSMDRGDIHTKEDFFKVVASCEKCHFKLDREMSKEERVRIIEEIIQNRGLRYEHYHSDEIETRYELNN